jgi:hypothetical protein
MLRRLAASDRQSFPHPGARRCVGAAARKARLLGSLVLLAVALAAPQAARAIACDGAHTHAHRDHAIPASVQIAAKGGMPDVVLERAAVKSVQSSHGVDSRRPVVPSLIDTEVNAAARPPEHQGGFATARQWRRDTPSLAARQQGRRAFDECGGSQTEHPMPALLRAAPAARWTRAGGFADDQPLGALPEVWVHAVTARLTTNADQPIPGQDDHPRGQGPSAHGMKDSTC